MKHRRLSLLLVGFVSAIAAACQPAPPAGLAEADKAAIRKVVEDTLVIGNGATRDWAAYAGLYYAADAVVLPPDGPAVEGRAAIERWLAAFPAFSDLKFEILELDGRGDLAYARGRYTMMMTPPGAPAPVHVTGKYLEIWRKQQDGSWKVTHDTFNSDMPPPPPAPPTPAPSAPQRR